jgi:hypothetical protein
MLSLNFSYFPIDLPAYVQLQIFDHVKIMSNPPQIARAKSRDYRPP